MHRGRGGRLGDRVPLGRIEFVSAGFVRNPPKDSRFAVLKIRRNGECDKCASFDLEAWELIQIGGRWFGSPEFRGAWVGLVRVEMAAGNSGRDERVKFAVDEDDFC